jgi:hypothetical protein
MSTVLTRDQSRRVCTGINCKVECTKHQPKYQEAFKNIPTESMARESVGDEVIDKLADSVLFNRLYECIRMEGYPIR